jgi:hypothetical protein
VKCETCTPQVVAIDKRQRDALTYRHLLPVEAIGHPRGGQVQQRLSAAVDQGEMEERAEHLPGSLLNVFTLATIVSPEVMHDHFFILIWLPQSKATFDQTANFICRRTIGPFLD